VPEQNLWTLWCKGRLTEANTSTIRLGATPSGLSSAHLHHDAVGILMAKLVVLPLLQVTMANNRLTGDRQIKPS